MSVQVCNTAIPVSFYLSSNDTPSPERSCSLWSRDFTTSLVETLAETENPSPEVSSTTTFPASSPNHTLISDSVAPHQPNPAPTSNASAAQPRKRGAEPQKDDPKEPKKPKRTRIHRNHIAQAPLTPPTTPRTIPVRSASPALPTAHSHANALPPASIVTKSNRTTQQFKNGVTSVQVQRPSAIRAEPKATVTPSPRADAAPGSDIPATAATAAVPQTSNQPVDPPSGNNDMDTSRLSQTSSDSAGCGQPAVNWDCHTHVLQDQKIYTTYEKPSTVVSSSIGTNKNTPPQAYNKMTTKTVTITITTTIATTEILKPGEHGYEEAVERHRRQSRLSIEEKERLKRDYEGSKAWASPEGARKLNGEKHWILHRGAEAGRMSNMTTAATNTANRTSDPQAANSAKSSPGVQQDEKQVQVKIELPEHASMDEIEELVKVKLEKAEL